MGMVNFVGLGGVLMQKQIKNALHFDDTCKRRYVANGWPEHRQDLQELLLPYWPKNGRSCMKEEEL